MEKEKCRAYKLKKLQKPKTKTIGLSHFFRYVVKFWRPIYETMFSYLLENNVLLENQSGFKPDDSCITQLLATTHEIYSSFDENYEVRFPR